MATPLQLTDEQAAALAEFIAAAGPMAEALGAGVVAASAPSTQLLPLAAPVGPWATMTTAQQATALQGSAIIVAAILAQLGLPIATGINATVPLPPVTTNPGQLVFINGILTSYTPAS
jgi:hypothetical protein